MKQVTKDIMLGVTKAQAEVFCLKMKQIWLGKNLPPSQFGACVKAALIHIGIEADFTDGTANAVCTKMERKAGFDII